MCYICWYKAEILIWIVTALRASRLVSFDSIANLE